MSEGDTIIQSRRKREGQGRWYFLMDLTTERWTANRARAKRYVKRLAQIIVRDLLKKAPDFETQVVPATVIPKEST